VRARLTILLLAAFVAVDLVLVALAFQHTSAPPPTGPAVHTRSQLVPDVTGSPTGSSSRSGSATNATGPTGPSYLDLAPDGTVLRATRGDCDSKVAPVVNVSKDLGTSFRAASVRGLTEVLRVEVETTGVMWLVGRDDTCQVTRWTSSDGGRSWSRVKGAGGSWYLAPSPNARAIFAPAGRRSTPCVPVGVSTIDADVVRLLCTAGEVFGTSDGGSSWVQLGRLEGAVSIRYTTTGDGVAVASQPGCPAAVMRTVDGGTNWTREICLAGDQPLAVGADGNLVGALVGDLFYTSKDAGRTWSH
jgi:photosystem II stability/assembly factor-like uncharacterized protein